MSIVALVVFAVVVSAVSLGLGLALDTASARAFAREHPDVIAGEQHP